MFAAFGFGLDLASINIQRGRDHGLPPYTLWREPCGLSSVKSWNDLNKIMTPASLDRLRRVYRNAEDIDLWSGGLAERPISGALVGPTFACILAQQVGLKTVFFLLFKWNFYFLFRQPK